MAGLTVGAIGNCVVTCFITTLVVTLVTFLAIFGLQNPDPEAWLGITAAGERILFKSRTEGEMEGATQL